MKNKPLFEVDKDGLKELQLGKPKTYLVRELVQNAWDEDTDVCNVVLDWGNGITTITVEDDSPEGFRNIADAYTLFGKTYKRTDPSKRGRFNLGEKQVIAISEETIIETTKGMIVFDRKGRREYTTGRNHGSVIIVKVKTTKAEYEEIKAYATELLVPQDLKYVVNESTIPYLPPYKVFEASLTTEIEKDGVYARTVRKTKVNIIKGKEKNWIYEIGIPVQEIDCEYGIDVQQKIPLGIDRETVLPSFLKDLYAEVLNQVYNEIVPENSSKLWVRDATSDKRVSQEAVKSVITQRYGDKSCIANPSDPISNDEAIARGYRLVYGSEMSKEEWGQVKESSCMQSSTEMFGANFVDAETIDPTEDMKKFGEYAKKIAKRTLDIDISVGFVKSKATTVANFGDCCMTVNVTRTGTRFFKETVSSETTDLILHELGHYAGHHTEKEYHQLLTKMAGDLVMIALKESEFFRI